MSSSLHSQHEIRVNVDDLLRDISRILAAIESGPFYNGVEFLAAHITAQSVQFVLVDLRQVPDPRQSHAMFDGAFPNQVADRLVELRNRMALPDSILFRWPSLGDP